jgi:FAD/FMN-containing dehydrogenase/Fe-S oxidoreductase
MDAEQSRIEADLRGVLDGEVFCHPLRTQLYATDASIYEITPLAVVRPRHAEDVAQCVKYAAENSIPLLPRGGGTGLAGQSLGPGIVIDFSRFMRRLIHLDRDNLTVRVQPGMALAELNRVLAKDKLVFGPDPPTRAVTTIGSVLAIDTLGSHFLRYGTAGETILSAQAVLSDGEQVVLQKTSWRSPTSDSSRLNHIASEVGQLLWANRAVTKAPPWKGVARGCGYRLEASCDHDNIDLARLQSGAEGTLSILTEATVKLEPMPGARGVVLMFFEKLELAARAAIDARRDNVAACDLMDRRLIEIARELDPRYESMLPRGAEALLLIEQQGNDAPEVRAKLGSLIQRLVRRAPSTQHTRIVVDDDERDFIWKLSRRVIPRLYRLKGSSRPLPFVEDISIPPDRLPEFLIDMQNILKADRVTGTLFAHAAHGHLHLRPFLDPNEPSDIEKIQRISDRIFEKVIEFRGVISGEHAVGLSRSSYMRQQLGELYPICRRIKELFDPKGILNPGKIITDAAQRTAENLRPTSIMTHSTRRVITSKEPLTAVLGSELEVAGEADEATDFPANESSIGMDQLVEANAVALKSFLPILNWTEEDSMESASNACNGCGRCRSNAPSERMCPMFRSTRAEEASPRAKANILRGLLSGKLPIGLAESDEMKEIADLCFHCHQCKIDCPASVDIPKLMLEIKAQYTATNGLRISDRLLSRLDLLTSLASRFPMTANWALENKYSRWLLEKTTGIAQGRRLPRISKQPFMRWAAKNRLTRPNRGGGRKVLYLVDHYANWNNPIVGIALAEVLKHQNVEVYVPTWQSVTFMTKIVMGDIEKVRGMIGPQIRQLAEAVRQGYQIVTTEPTAALCLKFEYMQILDNEDAKLVAANTWDAGQYLWQMHTNNELELDFRPLTTTVIYHTPCHLRAIDPGYTGMRLLSLIPGLSVQLANAGCSGMAGTYGIRKQTYRTSLRVGWNLISTMQDTTAQIGSTECSTCKLQMEQGIDKPTLHPLALMAYAYGKLPEVRAWIQSKNEGLTVQ